VVSYFADRLPKQLAETQLCDLGKKSELGFLSNDLVAIDQHDSVLHAFQVIVFSFVLQYFLLTSPVKS
jgi:hypothetical protein